MAARIFLSVASLGPRRTDRSRLRRLVPCFRSDTDRCVYDGIENVPRIGVCPLGRMYRSRGPAKHIKKWESVCTFSSLASSAAVRTLPCVIINHRCYYNTSVLIRCMCVCARECVDKCVCACVHAQACTCALCTHMYANLSACMHLCMHAMHAYMRVRMYSGICSDV